MGLNINNSNVGPVSPIHNDGKVNEIRGTGSELEFHSSSEVRQTLKSGPGDVNLGAIKESIAGLNKKLSNDLRDDFKGAVNSSLLAPLVSDVSPAAKMVADACQNSPEEPSIGETAGAIIALTVLEGEKDKGNG